MGYLLEDREEGRDGNGEHPLVCPCPIAPSCHSSGTGWEHVKENAETHHSDVIRKQRDTRMGIRLGEHKEFGGSRRVAVSMRLPDAEEPGRCVIC